jgi:hypothetical protein
MGWLSCSNKCLRLWCCGTCRLFREDPILYVRAEHLHDLRIREPAVLQEGVCYTLDAGPHGRAGQKSCRLGLVASVECNEVLIAGVRSGLHQPLEHVRLIPLKVGVPPSPQVLKAGEEFLVRERTREVWGEAHLGTPPCEAHADRGALRPGSLLAAQARVLALVNLHAFFVQPPSEIVADHRVSGLMEGSVPPLIRL